MLANMSYLSVVIPAYNEAKRLPETLVLVKDYLDAQTYDSQVLVVDDGSTDHTVLVVREFRKRFPRLELLQNRKNIGKGESVKRGMLEATGEYRLFMDADHSTPITELPKLMKYINTYPVVIGSRYLKSGSIKLKQPLQRRIISRGGNWLIQRLVLSGIKDTQCGFKLFTAEATKKIFPRLTMSGWSLDLELLAIAKLQGYAIKEVAVEWYDAKHSSLRASRDASRFLHDLWQIRRNLRTNRYN